MRGFDKLIQKISRYAEVLDVGAWGLKGENTTKPLLKRFFNVMTMNVKPLEGVDKVADFYRYNFGRRKFDLIVLDLDMQNNVGRDWTRRGLEHIYDLLSKGGVVIIYALTNRKYSFDPKVNQMVESHLDSFWKCRPLTPEGIASKLAEFADLFTVFGIEKDGERDNVIWVALKRHE